MKNIRSHERGRREFLQQSLLLVSTLPVVGSLVTGCNDSSDMPPNGEQAVKEYDPAAASLGYKPDATMVDVEKFPKREGPEGEKQFCKSCQFYTARNNNWGTCQVVRSGDVKAGGWCSSWSPKS